MNFLLCKSYERIIYDFLTWKFRSKFHLDKMKSRILRCNIYFAFSFFSLYMLANYVWNDVVVDSVENVCITYE